MSGILSNIKKAVGPAKDIMKSRQRNAPNSAKLQFPTSEKLYYGMYFKFNKIQYELEPGAKAKFSNLTEGAHIFLPLPVSGLIENLGINYQQQEVGVVGQLINAGANMADFVKDNVTGEALNTGNLLAAEAGVRTASGVAAYTFRKLANEVIPGAGAIIDMKTGNVVNPYTLALFQSVAPRAHNFTFRLFPRNQADSDAIREIVNQFKWHSLPARQSQFFLTMPSEVELAFYGTDKLFKFAPCVITNISVNYTPLGQNAFFGQDGAPVGVEITLSFQEIESLTRESYEADGVKDAFNTGQDRPSGE